jgi:protein-S-isoprenylcysteine O-methyltransferase Ste14
MDPTAASRFLFPSLLAAFLLLDLVWPLLRLRRLAGTWGITVHRSRDPRQRLLSLALLAVLASLGIGAARFAVGGAPALGAAPAPGWLAAAGLAAAAAGVALVAVAQRQMGASLRVGLAEETTELVQRGLFLWIRNPIFVGMLLVLGGFVLLAPGVWTIATWLAGAASVALQVRLEEEHLRACHGERYLAYASRVGRFLPGIGRLQRGPGSPA